MKVLVTGSRGQVGRSLIEQLQTTQWELLALDRQSLDITDADQVFSTVLDFCPDVIVNTAAYTAVDQAESDRERAYAINRDGPENLAQAASRCGAALLHISTDYVYSGDGSALYRETDTTNPQSVYGESKLAGEQRVAAACDRHIILRTAWVFGEYGNNFVKTMLKLGRERQALSVVDDQLGGPTYAGDIASALVVMVAKIERGEALEWGIYHYSGFPHLSWYSFAAEIFERAQASDLLSKIPSLSPIATSDYPTPAIRPANSRLSCEKITEKMSIPPSNWRAALDDLKAYC